MLTDCSRPNLAVINEDFPKIRTIQTKEEIEGIINFLVSILNIKVSDREEQKKMDVQMVLVYDLILTKFGHLTVPEIKEAMKMYVAKEFPEIKVFRLLDCVSIGEILNAFVEFRNESLRVYSDKKTKQNLLPEITSSQKDEILKSGVNRKFEEFIKTKDVEEPCEYIFDFLVEQGLILVPGENTPKRSEYYDEKRKQAKQQLISELSKMTSVFKNERTDIKVKLERIKQGDSKKIIVRAKRLILIDFFQSRVDSNETLIFKT